MRRILIPGRIGGPRSAPIAIVLLLGLSAASHGRDGDKAAPVDARTHASRGDALAEDGETSKAIAAYTEAIALDARYAYAYSRRASAWMVKHERGKAIADYSTAIALEPENPAHFLSRGTVWSRQGDHDPAIADFDEAIRLGPNDAAAYLARATEWEKDSQPDRAMADYQRAVALDPGATPAYEGRGRIWTKRGEFDQLIASYAEFARLAPQNPIGHRELAWLLATCEGYGLRDGRRAVKEATAACELTRWAEPRSIEALAAACAEVGDFDAAVKWQTHAIGIFLAGTDRIDRRIRFRRDAAMNLRLYRYRKHMPHHERPDRAG